MTKETTKERVARVLSEQLGLKKEEVTDDVSIRDASNGGDPNNNLGADSLDNVEIVMAIEEEFETDIPDEDAEEMNTPKDIVDYLVGKGL